MKQEIADKIHLIILFFPGSHPGHLVANEFGRFVPYARLPKSLQGSFMVEHGGVSGFASRAVLALLLKKPASCAISQLRPAIAFGHKRMPGCESLIALEVARPFCFPGDLKRMP